MSNKLTKLEKHLIKQELERLRKEDKFQYDFIREHDKMYSRRDFMGLSLLGGYSMLALPGILSILPSRLNAQDMDAKCGSTDSNAANPFAGNIHLELAGGACLGSAFIPYTMNGGNLSNSGYAKFGYSPAIIPNSDNTSTEFGAGIHKESSFYKALMKTFQDNDIDPNTLKGKLQIITIIARSENDNANTESSCGNLIREITGAGKIADIVGTGRTVNGIRSRSAGNINKYSSSLISNNPSSVSGLVELGVIADRLSKDEAEKILKAAEKMSARRLASFKKQTISDQLKTLIECGYYKANKTVFGNDLSTISSAGDPIYTGIFGAADFQKAAITKLVLKGNARSGGIVLSGYDYHNGQTTGTTSGHTKRFEAGTLVAKIVSAAVKESASLTMQVTTDGSASCRGGNVTGNVTNGILTGAGFYANRVEDASVGMELKIVYHPNGFKEEFTSHQIGGYTESGSINLSANAISNNQTTKSIAMAANYLNMHGKIDQLDAVCKKLGLTNPFSDKNILNSVLVVKEHA